MESALHVGRFTIPRVALATGAVVAATFAAAIAAWSALPGNAAGAAVVGPRAHARPVARMNMSGMKMPGMTTTASRRQ